MVKKLKKIEIIGLYILFFSALIAALISAIKTFGYIFVPYSRVIDFIMFFVNMGICLFFSYVTYYIGDKINKIGV